MIVRILALTALLAAAAGCGSVLAPPDDGTGSAESPHTPGPGDGGAPGGAGGGEAPDVGEAPADVQEGAQLFAANCQACHGANAAGGAMYPGSLQGRTGILGQVRNGGGGMPAFPASVLGDPEVGKIEAYLVWLAAPGNGDGGDGDGGIDVPPMSPFAANCSGCHGPTGEGTTLAPQIRAPHEGYAEWVVRNGRNTMGFPQPMPQFTEEQVSAEALGEIFTFLHEQPMPADGQGLYLRFCGNCHGPTGSGGVVGESARDKADKMEDIREIVRGGEGGTSYGSRSGFMPARSSAELPDADLEKIRDFLNGRG